MSTDQIKDVVDRTKAYYDGPADEIYSAVYGDNLHLAIPPHEGASHQEAMQHTNELMGEAVTLTPDTHVLDLGSGYGSTARFLAKTYGCPVTCSNLSERENEISQQRADEAGLGHLVKTEYGDFHDLSYPDNSFEVVWSQEAFLHGADKAKIMREAFRVAKPGGWFVFTDVTVKGGTPEADRQRIYDRIKTSNMWDISDYEQGLANAGFTVTRVDDWSQYVAPSYGAVVEKVKAQRDTLIARTDEQTVDNTIGALTFWVDSAAKGNIGWALFVARKPQ
ncbi:MAG: methyltransferase domain-containing protein [Dehalococcoidia bacterium]